MGVYRCCGESRTSIGCKTADSHIFKLPSTRNTLKELRNAPAPEGDKSTKPAAVALKCDFTDKGEVISICVVDFLTRDILLNKCVDLGMSGQKLKGSHATKNRVHRVVGGSPLRTISEVQEELFKIIDSNTILLGHSLKLDLTALNVSHARIVDSHILAQRAGESFAPTKVGRTGQWSLDQVSSVFTGSQLKKLNTLTTSRQNASAIRDVVLSIVQAPRILHKWAGYVRHFVRYRDAEGDGKAQRRKSARHPRKPPQNWVQGAGFSRERPPPRTENDWKTDNGAQGFDRVRVHGNDKDGHRWKRETKYFTQSSIANNKWEKGNRRKPNERYQTTP